MRTIRLSEAGVNIVIRFVGHHLQLFWIRQERQRGDHRNGNIGTADLYNVRMVKP
jgi:hypothetical protein